MKNNTTKTTTTSPLVILICLLSCHYSVSGWDPHGLKGATEMVGKSAEEVAKILAAAVENASKAMGAEAVNKVCDAGVEAAKITGDAGITAAERLGKEASAQWAPVAGAAIAVYATVQLTSMGRDLYSSYNPDEEKKARINVARETNDFFDTRRGLRDCLHKNAGTPRNDYGRPTTCEDVARMFLMIAGKPALDEMTENFKSAYRI